MANNKKPRKKSSAANLERRINQQCNIAAEETLRKLHIMGTCYSNLSMFFYHTYRLMVKEKYFLRTEALINKCLFDIKQQWLITAIYYFKNEGDICAVPTSVIIDDTNLEEVMLDINAFLQQQEEAARGEEFSKEQCIGYGYYITWAEGANIDQLEDVLSVNFFNELNLADNDNPIDESRVSILTIDDVYRAIDNDRFQALGAKRKETGYVVTTA